MGCDYDLCVTDSHKISCIPQAHRIPVWGTKSGLVSPSHCPSMCKWRSNVMPRALKMHVLGEKQKTQTQTPGRKNEIHTEFIFRGLGLDVLFFPRSKNKYYKNHRGGLFAPALLLYVVLIF